MQAERIQPLVVTGNHRIKRLPDVPTFLELGVTSYFFRPTLCFCVYEPAGLPEPVAQRLSDRFVQAGSSKAVQKFMDANAFEEPPEGRAAFKKIYEREDPIWTRKAQGLRLVPQ